MKDLQELYLLAEKQNVDVYSWGMEDVKSMSIMLSDGCCAIALDPLQMETSIDEKMKLAHELGHCLTGSFYNKYSPIDNRRKCEATAIRWEIHNLVPYDELKHCLKLGYSVNDLIDFFDVTEDTIRKAYYHYKDTLGLSFADDEVEPRGAKQDKLIIPDILKGAHIAFTNMSEPITQDEIDHLAEIFAQAKAKRDGRTKNPSEEGRKEE